ncbi:MAG: phosphodiester glycosidase family protein [Mucilaginibacter sp.]|uniref:phosphodiester glycosidase family protein n=1 Tax=Mucilaginibacter sp. TaxID=1882438 RepID=UPI0032665AB1
MKKHCLFVFIASLIGFNAFAQSDSITFVKARWETQEIAPGLIFKHFQFEKCLFDTNENISILEINPSKKLKIALGYEKQLLKKVSDFGKSANALAAINGSFFDVKNGGSVDMLRFNGELISTNHLDKSGERARHQRSALLFNKGKLSIAKWDGTPDWESKLSGDMLNTGPLLIYNNSPQVLDSTLFTRARHPRTAIVITHNRVLLITVDGRNANSAGVNLHELTKILTWLKANQGINLDGGGSTTLWTNKNGVMNYPCDNKKWDHEGERKVANVVLVTQ